MEAVAMSGLYGLVTLLLLFVLTGLITPTIDHQLRGWRRARKQGNASLPRFGDAATAFWVVLVMALAGAAGWFLFTRALVESRWFPGHLVPLHILGIFAAVLLSAGLGFQALLEARGARTLGLASIFVGLVPVLLGTVLGSISDRMIPLASWLIGISPVSLPFYASGTLLSIAELPAQAARAIPRAFAFWLLVGSLTTAWLIFRLWIFRKEMAKTSLPLGEKPPASAPPEAAR